MPRKGKISLEKKVEIIQRYLLGKGVKGVPQPLLELG